MILFLLIGFVFSLFLRYLAENGEIPQYYVISHNIIYYILFPWFFCLTVRFQLEVGLDNCSNVCRFQYSVTTLLKLFHKKMNRLIMIKTNSMFELTSPFERVTKYDFIDLFIVIFTEEILIGKPHFLCSGDFT